MLIRFTSERYYVFQSVLALICALACQAKRPPHIIVFLADDLGWADVGWHNEEIKTPYLDHLVKRGVELDRHYAYQQCSPTRSSFMTGRLPHHVNLENPRSINSIGGVDLRMTMLPKKLQEVGYETAMVGKWHLGARSQNHLPRKRGFDKFFGYLTGGTDHFTQKSSEAIAGFDHDGPDGWLLGIDLWRNDAPAYGEDNKFYGSDMYTQESIRIIMRHNVSNPLFLYISMQAPHGPYQCPGKYMNRSIDYEDRRMYHCMITCIDNATYDITEALRSRGMWRNTFFLWSSDNGAPQYKNGNNYPLRGGKGKDFEGGVRVAAFVAGGAVNLPHGTKLKQMIHIADWYATFCAMAGCDPADNVDGVPEIDSLDQSTLFQDNDAPQVRNSVHISLRTVIHGDLKLLTGPHGGMHCHSGCGFWTSPTWPVTDERTPVTEDKACGPEGCLFNLTDDPTESEDLSTNPLYLEDLKRLQKMLRRANKTSFQTDRDDPEAPYCLTIAKYMDHHRGHAGPVCYKNKRIALEDKVAKVKHKKHKRSKMRSTKSTRRRRRRRVLEEKHALVQHGPKHIEHMLARDEEHEKHKLVEIRHLRG